MGCSLLKLYIAYVITYVIFGNIEKYHSWGRHIDLIRRSSWPKFSWATIDCDWYTLQITKWQSRSLVCTIYMNKPQEIHFHLLWRTHCWNCVVWNNPSSFENFSYPLRPMMKSLSWIPGFWWCPFSSIFRCSSSSTSWFPLEIILDSSERLYVSNR